MSANIEALVKKHSRAFSGDVRGLRNALTEQAEAFKGELQAYDGTVRELTKTVEDMRAAQSVLHYDPSTADVPPPGHPLQKLGEYLSLMLDEDEWATAEEYLLAAWAQSVPVVGEPAGYFPDESRADEIDAPPLPVYFAPTHSIPAAELATLRELADAFTAERKARDSIAFEFNKVSRELEALRKEAERWRKANEGGKFCISEWAAISKEWVDMLPETAIERIDAAIAQGKGE